MRKENIEIDYSEFTGCKTLTWKTLFNHVGEA